MDTDARTYSSISISMDLSSKKRHLDLPAYKIEIILIMSFSLVEVGVFWEIHGVSLIKLLCIHKSEIILGFLLVFVKKIPVTLRVRTLMAASNLNKDNPMHPWLLLCHPPLL